MPLVEQARLSEWDGYADCNLLFWNLARNGAIDESFLWREINEAVDILTTQNDEGRH